MNDARHDLEDLLRGDLARAVSGPPRTDVDVAGVARVGRGERRRRRVAGVAGAAAVLLVVAGLGFVLPQRGGGVDPAAPPAGAPLGLAWAERDGTVHLPSGERLQVETPVQLFQRGGTVLVGEGELDDVRWSLVADASSAPRLDPLARDLENQPVISVDGSRVAWARDEAGVWEVRVRDVDRPGPDVRVLAPDAGGRGWRAVTDVDDAGRVVVLRRDGTQLLVPPDGAPREVAPVSGGVTLLPGGRAVRYSDGGASSRADLVDLADGGATTVVGPLRPGYVTGWAPDARTYVASMPRGLLELVSVAPDGTTERHGILDLPDASGQWVPFGWESATSVVLSDDEAAYRLLRCSTASTTCTPVPPGPWAVVARY